ncbi:MAG: hypothetical protein HAW62_01255 [Endozoicomonadaceae bacterium]|nr:hypothetical protein [Endozoicomonadaceae bacterium]
MLIIRVTSFYQQKTLFFKKSNDFTGGKIHDSKITYSLMLKIKDAGYFIADKGYDSA